LAKVEKTNADMPETKAIPSKAIIKISRLFICYFVSKRTSAEKFSGRFGSINPAVALTEKLTLARYFKTDSSASVDLPRQHPRANLPETHQPGIFTDPNNRRDSSTTPAEIFNDQSNRPAVVVPRQAERPHPVSQRMNCRTWNEPFRRSLRHGSKSARRFLPSFGGKKTGGDVAAWLG
jgi:hypothetical protein